MARSWPSLACCLLLKTVISGVRSSEDPNSGIIVPDVLHSQTAEQFYSGQSGLMFQGLTLASANTFLRRSNNYSTTSELLVVLSLLGMGRANCTVTSSVLNVSSRGSQTWLPVSINFSKSASENVHCLCSSDFPLRAAADPTRQDMVFLIPSFNTSCSSKIMMVIGTELHTVTSSGADNLPAKYRAVTTLPIANTTTEYKLVTFGGCSGGRVECEVFKNDLWSVTIDRSRREAGRWKRMDVIQNTTQPLARTGAFLFHDNGSLLLVGGVRVVSGKVTRCRDLWRYSIFEKQWFRLKPRNLSHQPLPDFAFPSTKWYLDNAMISLTAAFQEIGGVLCMFYSQSDRWHVKAHTFLTACRVEWQYFSCAGPTPSYTAFLGQGENRYLIAGRASFFIFSSDMPDGPASRVDVSASLSGNCEELISTESAVPNPSASLTFSGFHDCYGGSPILAQNSYNGNGDGLGVRTLLIFGGKCSADVNMWRSKYNETQLGMPVWTLGMHNRSDGFISAQYTLQYVQPGPSMPRRVEFTSTAFSAFKSVLYGGYDSSTFQLADESPWCFHMDDKWEHMRWEKLRVSIPQPLPGRRSGHVAMNLSNTTIMIHGGSSSTATILCDLWLLVVKENSCSGYWMNVTGLAKGKPLPCRAHHTATPTEYGVLLYGGEVAGTQAKGEERIALTLLMIEIGAIGINIVVSRVPITPRIPLRSHHSLTWYTATELLLLGGWHYNYTLNENVRSQAFLIQLSYRAEGLTAKAIPFFKFAIERHHVVGEFVLSGYISGSNMRKNFFYRLRNGHNCPVGYGRTRNNSCQPCEIGYYSDAIAQQCQSCGKHLTTKHTGASECVALDPCIRNFCNGHGKCFVDQANKANCKCEFGYLPDDNCKLPIVYIYQLAAVVLTAIIATLVISIVKFIMKRRDFRNKERECRDNYCKLRCSERKMEQINNGAKLNWEDLTLQEPPISRGTHSTVFKAQLTDMTVAVKQFRDYVSISDATPYDIFIKEAETLRSLRHPNIVMFLAAGVDHSTGRPFLVTEYLQQGSLYDILHDSSANLTYGRRVKFALDGARGMEYLHGSSPPRLHRDIKTPNLLVSGNGVLKIGDLETARLLAILDRGEDDRQHQEEQPPVAETTADMELHSTASWESAMSGSDESDRLRTPLLAANVQVNTSGCQYERPRLGMTCGVGTDRWRSPESIKKNTYNEKTDVYSFGVVLWEILTRQTPYRHLTDSEQIEQEIVDGNKPILPPSAPYPFRHIAERCLKTQPKGRPSFSAIVRDLTSQQHIA